MMEPESSQSTGSQLPNPEDAEQSTVSAADTDAALGEGEALEVSSLSAQSPVVALSEEEPPLDPKMLLSPEPSTRMRTRLRFMVADEALTVRVDPEALPEQPIDASGQLANPLSDGAHEGQSNHQVAIQEQCHRLRAGL